MARAGYDEVALVTGFPSFTARRICTELARDRSRRVLVHVVMRAKFEREARLVLDELSADDRARIQIVEGDASSIDMGLSGAEFNALAAEVDVVHHCANVSYQGALREVAEQVNLGSARELIEFGAVCKDLKSVVVQSTAYVSGDRAAVVREEDLDAGQKFRNVVEETRARAEKLLRGRMASMPIAIARATTIVGDSTTGDVDRFDGPYLLMLIILTAPPDFALPLPGRGDAPLHLVPIDFVARAAIAISRDSRARGRTFHVADPAPLPARRVFELVARAGGHKLPRGFIPANLTKAILRTPGLERFAKSPRAFLDTLATDVRYDTTNADEILSAQGIRCPSFETYVDRIVQHVETRVHAKRSKRERAGIVEAPLSAR